MTVDELKQRLEKEIDSVTAKSGKAVLFSPTGPISVGMAEAIIAAIAEQQKQIQELHRRLDEGDVSVGP